MQHATSNIGGGPLGAFARKFCDGMRDDEVLVIVATGWAGEGRLNTGRWNRENNGEAWVNMLKQLRAIVAAAPVGSTVCLGLQCGHEADVGVNSATLLPAAVESDINLLRAEFGNFPVVMMEIGNVEPGENQIAQQNAMAALAESMTGVTYIPRRAGATFMPDGIHYNQASQRLRGEDAAAAGLALNYGA